jgi:flagellar biosynthesis/type III secretory pathway ATPase
MILTVSGAEGADFAAEALADKFRSEGRNVVVFMDRENRKTVLFGSPTW